jgi:pyruvate/2-oxoglutarate dehydrogenase complex dihydrolipoamide acyltransferase (E2) component
MRNPIIVPELGAQDLVLSVWYVKRGEPVFAGDRLVELLLGSATFEIIAPCSGTLVEQSAWPDDRLSPGQVLGQVESDEASSTL